jgi:hypothetical protein
MRLIRQNLFLATVLTFALSSSGCAMLGQLLGGGGGGLDLGGILGGGGLGLTSQNEDDSGLALTRSQVRVRNGYQIKATENVPPPSRQESALYSAFE